MLIIRNLLNNIFNFIKRVIVPIIWPYRQYIAKKTAEVIYNYAIKELERLVRRSKNKRDDFWLKIYKKKLEKKVIKMINGAKADNVAIVAQINKMKNKNREIDFSINDNKIAVNIGNISTHFDKKSKKIKLGYNIKL